MSLTHLHDIGADGTYKQVELTLWRPGCWTLALTDELDGTHIVEKSLYTADDIIKGDFVLVSKGPASIETVIETIDEYDVSPSRLLRTVEPGSNHCCSRLVRSTSIGVMSPEPVKRGF